MVATSWTDFLKSPTSGKRENLSSLKVWMRHLNQALNDAWFLLVHTTSPVQSLVQYLWLKCGMLCWAGPVSPAPSCLARRRRINTPGTRTVSIGGGVGYCPQRRGDPDHKCLLCRPFWRGFGEGFGVFRCQEANLYSFLLLSPIVPHMSSENVTFWV